MICPVCHEESFAKKKNLTDGWKVVGEVKVCALCGAEWKEPGEHERKNGNDAGGESKNRLAALLGGDFREKVELSGSTDRKFCRNCKHFIIHPFKTLCALSDQAADPMSECAFFEPKQ